MKNVKYLKDLLRDDIFKLRDQFNKKSLELLEKIKEEEKLIEENKGTDEEIKKLKDDMHFNINVYNNRSMCTLMSEIIYISELLNKIMNGKYVDKIDMEYITERLKKENLEEKEIVYILELLKVSNKHVTHDKVDYSKTFAVKNMLTMGYEYIEKPSNKNEKLKEAAIKFDKTIDCTENKDVELLFEGLNYLSDDDKKYVYQVLLCNYQDDMLSSKQVLDSLEMYKDNEIVKMAKDDFYNTLYKYQLIRNKYDELSKDKINETDENVLESGAINNLYYSTNNKELPEKSYIVSDMKSVPEEDYLLTFKLIAGFKKGDISHVKYLSGTDGFIELKDGQVRIIIKPLGNSNYSVQGMFIKKDTSDYVRYPNICGRVLASIDDEYSKLVDDYLNDVMLKQARKSK